MDTWQIGILSLGIFGVGVITGLLLYHLVCEVKIRQIRQASKAWREKRKSLIVDSQTFPPSAKNS